MVTALNNRGEAVKEMLTARLHAFETMFNQGGTEITEKISRNSSNLGNLITRHITEFDHTVKNYGGELVGRLRATHARCGRSPAELRRHLRPARVRPHRRNIDNARPTSCAV